MLENIIYASDSCPYCQMAYKLLDKKKITYKKIIVNTTKLWDEMFVKTNRNTVPQIFISGIHIGGFDDLSAANFDGKLDKLISG